MNAHSFVRSSGYRLITRALVVIIVLTSIPTQVGNYAQPAHAGVGDAHTSPDAAVGKTASTIDSPEGYMLDIEALDAPVQFNPLQPDSLQKPLVVSRVQSTYHHAGLDNGSLTVVVTVKNTLLPQAAPQSTPGAPATDILRDAASFDYFNDPNTIRNVLLVDSLTTDASFVTASPTPQHSGTTYTWNLGDIPPQGTVTATLTLDAPTVVSDFLDLDTGMHAYGTLGDHVVNASAAPIQLAPDALGDWLQWTIDADYKDTYLQAQAAALGYDPQQIFDYVSALAYESYSGSLRGTRGTLWSEAGNALDQSSLLIAMLRASGIPARYRHGTLSNAQAQGLISSMFPDPTGLIGHVPDGVLISVPTEDEVLLAEAHDHWWVEAYLPSAGGWQDLDPTLGGSIGERFVEDDALASDGTDRIVEVPDSVRHKVSLRIKVEVYHPLNVGNGGRDISYPMNITLNTVELVGEPLELRHLVNTNANNGMIFYVAEHTYIPYLTLGDEIIQGEPFQEIVSNFPFGTFIVTGEWLLVDVRHPDGSVETFEREIVDRVGYAARAGGGVVSASVGGTEPLTDPQSSLSILVAPSIVPPEALNASYQEMADAATRVQEGYDLAQALEDAPTEDYAMVPELRQAKNDMAAAVRLSQKVGLLNYATISDFGTRRLGTAFLVRPYYDSPRILLSSWQQDQTGDQSSFSFDLRHNDVRTVLYPGQSWDGLMAFNTMRGMQETTLESHLLEQITGIEPVGVLEVFDQAEQQHIPLAAITYGTMGELNDLAISAEAKARISHALRDNPRLAIVVPSQSVEINGMSTVGWFQIDLVNGDISDVMENGQHFTLASYGKLTLQAATNMKDWVYAVVGFFHGMAVYAAAFIATVMNHAPFMDGNIKGEWDTMMEEAAEKTKQVADFISGVRMYTSCASSLGGPAKVVDEKLRAYLDGIGPQIKLDGLSTNQKLLWKCYAGMGNKLSGIDAPLVGSTTKQSDSFSVGGFVNGSLFGASMIDRIDPPLPTALADRTPLQGVAPPLAARQIAVSGSGSQTVSGALNTPFAAFLSGTSASFYAPAVSGLGVGGDSTGYDAANFAPAATFSTQDARVLIGPSSGSLNIGGSPVSAAGGLALVDYSGTVGISEHDPSTDQLQLDGNASFFTLHAQPASSTTDTTAPVRFEAAIDASFSDDVLLMAEGPQGWQLAIDDNGQITATPPRGTAPGDYTILVRAQSVSHPALVLSAEHTVTTTDYSGMEMDIAPDPTFTVPWGLVESEQAFNDINNGQLQVPGAAFTVDLVNTSTSAHTFDLEVTGLPAGWAVFGGAAGQTSAALHLDGGEVGQLGLYVSPPATELPPAGTAYAFTVQATSQDGTLNDSSSETFVVPAVAFSHITAAPDILFSSPGESAAFDLSLRNVGNVQDTLDLQVELPHASWTAPIVAPVSVDGGDEHVQNVTLSTPEGDLGKNYLLYIHAPAGEYVQTTELLVRLTSPEVRDLFRAAQSMSDLLPADMTLHAALSYMAMAFDDLTIACQHADTLAPAGQAECSTTLRDRAVSGVLGVVNYVDTLSPLITADEPMRQQAEAMRQHSTLVAIEADIATLRDIMQTMQAQLQDVVYHDSDAWFAPGLKVALDTTPAIFDLHLVNQGSQQTSYTITTGGSSNLDSITPTTANHTLDPGEEAVVPITASAADLGTYQLWADVQAVEATSIAPRRTHAGLRVVDALLEMPAVTLTPRFVEYESGTRPAASMRLANVANIPINGTAQVALYDEDDNLLNSSSQPVEIASSLAPVDYPLGLIDTSGLVTGTYTLRVSVVDETDTVIPRASGESSFAVGRMVEATHSVAPAVVAPGNADVTTHIETRLSDALLRQGGIAGGLPRLFAPGELDLFANPPQPFAAPENPSESFWHGILAAPLYAPDAYVIDTLYSAGIVRPIDIAPGPSGELYVIDGDHWIRRINPDGTVVNLSSFGAGFYPRSIAYGSDGNLYIGRWNNSSSSVIQMDPATGSYSAYANGDLTLDLAAWGNLLYVAEFDGNRVRQYNLDTGAMVNYASSSAHISGVAVGPDGSVYFYETRANNEGRTIRKVPPPVNGVDGGVPSPGAVELVAGMWGQGCPSSTALCGDGGPATSAQLGTEGTDHGGRLAVDAEGGIFYTDIYNHRVRYINADTGIIDTVAGNGYAGFAGDGAIAGGIGSSTSLNQPDGIFLDDSGVVYLADSSNGRIRTLTPAADQITVDISPATVVADLVDTATVIVEMRDALDNPLSGHDIQLLVGGSDNTISPADIVTTDASGTATFQVSSSRAEEKLFEVIDQTEGTTLLTETVAFIPGPMDPDRSSLNVDSTRAIADGVEAIRATAQLVDAYDNPLSGVAVSFDHDGSNIDISEMTPPGGVTDSTGTIQATLRTTTAQTVTISAINQDVGEGVPLNTTVAVGFVPGPPDLARSSMVIAPAEAVANDTDTVTVTATMIDAHDNPLANMPMLLAVTGSGNTITPASAINADGSGVVVFQIASSVAESKEIQVSDSTYNVSLPAQEVTFIPGVVDPATSTLSATPAAVPADGTTPVNLTVQVFDAFNNPVPGVDVVFETSADHVTLTQPAGSTGADGRASGTLVGTVDQMVTVRVQADGTLLDDSVQVRLIGPDLVSAISGPTTAIVGDEITFGLRLENQGQTAAQNVQLIATLPPEIDFVNHTSSAPLLQDGGTLTWEMGSVAAGQVIAFDLVGLLSPAAALNEDVTINLQATTSTVEADTSNNADSTSLEALPGYVFTANLEPTAASVPIGIPTTYEIVINNTGNLPTNYTLQVTDLDAGWFTLEHNQAALHPGEVGRIPLTILVDDCAAAGSYTFFVRVTAVETGDVRTLSGELNLSAEPVITNLKPEDTTSIGATSMLFSWETAVEGSTSLFLRQVGAADYTEYTGDPGTLHRVEVSGLARNTDYEWYVRTTSTCQPAGEESAPRTLRVLNGVAFEQREYIFNVERDYNQQRTITVQNQDVVSHTIVMTLTNPYPDLILGFINEGSIDEPFELGPGEELDITLAIHTQDVVQDTFDLVASLEADDGGGPPIMDAMNIKINVNFPNVDYTLEEVNTDPQTLITTYRVTNHGDPLTDLAITADTTGDGTIYLLPTMTHGYLKSGQSFTFEAIPVPGSSFNSLNASINATAAGEVESGTMQISVPPGSDLYLGEASDVSMEAKASDWYCTNRPIINNKIVLPAGFRRADVASARFLFSINSAWSSVRPHDVNIFLNDTQIGELTNTIPHGLYTFPISPTLLNESLYAPSVNNLKLVTTHMNGGHYVVASDMLISICLTSYREWVVASSQTEADDIVTARSFLVPAPESLHVEILEPADGRTVFVGGATPVRVQVTDEHGNTPAQWTSLSVTMQTDNGNGNLLLYDDGAHGDGGYRDGVYGNFWRPVNSGTTTLTINAGTCSVAGDAQVSVEVKNLDQQTNVQHDVPIDTIDVTTETIQPLPFTDTTSGDEMQIDWSYALTAAHAVQQHSVALSLLDMQPGEVREVVRRTHIDYTGDGGTGQIELEPLYVMARHIVAVEPAARTAGRGGSVAYDVRLHNPGASDTFTLTVTGLPGDWAQLAETIALEANEQTTLPLSIDVPPDSDLGSYLFTVLVQTGSGGEDQASALLDVTDMFDMHVMPEQAMAFSGDVVSYTVTLTNQEAVAHDYRLSVEGLAPSVVSLPDTVSIPANSAGSVVLEVEARGAQGLVPFTVRATPATTDVSRTAPAVLELLSGRELIAELAPEQHTTGRGVPAHYELDITNTGSIADTYEFALDLPAGWSYRLEANDDPITTFTLQPAVFNAATLSLLVIPAADTTPGDYQISVTVQSIDDPSAQVTLHDMLTVTPYGVQVQVTPDILALEATGTGTWTIDVTNTGTQADTYDLEATGMVAHSAQFSTAPVSLAPGQTRSIPLTASNLHFGLEQPHAFGITARSQADPTIENHDTADVRLKEYQDGAMQIVPSTRSLTDTMETTYALVITNTGNVDTTYFFTIDSDPTGLIFEAEFDEVFVPAHMSAVITIKVLAQVEDTYTIPISIHNADGIEYASDSATLHIAKSQEPADDDDDDDTPAPGDDDDDTPVPGDDDDDDAPAPGDDDDEAPAPGDDDDTPVPGDDDDTPVPGDDDDDAPVPGDDDDTPAPGDDDDDTPDQPAQTPRSIYLPLIAKAGYPDLVGQFTLDSDLHALQADDPVVVSVVVTNTGTAPTQAGFWVDLYINPTVPPDQTNLPWHELCQPDACIGVAWYVPYVLDVGERITLTTEHYAEEWSSWNGQLPGGTVDLYLYVDTWNANPETGAWQEGGAVPEAHEDNNGFQLPGLLVGAPTEQIPAQLSGLDNPHNWSTRPASLPE